MSQLSFSIINYLEEFSSLPSGEFYPRLFYLLYDKAVTSFHWVSASKLFWFPASSGKVVCISSPSFPAKRDTHVTPPRENTRLDFTQEGRDCSMEALPGTVAAAVAVEMARTGLCSYKVRPWFLLELCTLSLICFTINWKVIYLAS